MKKLYILLLTLTISTFSFGQVILNDSFNYADNSLLTANGWVVHSAGANSMDVGASNGLSYAGYNDGVASITGFVEGNAAKVDNTGEDLSKTFTPVPTGTIYFSFLLNVSNATAGYFIHLGNSATTFASRVFVKPGSVGGTFNLGLSNTGTASFAATPTDFVIGNTYLVIVKYDVSATGAGSVWVKSSGVPATEVAAGAPEHTTTGTGQVNIDRACLRQFSATQNETVDALFVSSTWMGTAACSLALGVETSTCDAITLAIDTYNTSIPFTGGNSGAYVLSSNFGVVGGDNPNTQATGNITISNIPEGTNATLTITGTCGLSKNITSPSCKPVNALPYYEPFNYTVGNPLGAEQMWATVNAGDDIAVASGNLTYPGITPANNSVTFVGVGAEARTPFTNTTSGTLHTAFLVTASDLSNVTVDLTQTYFAVLTDNLGGFVGRLWIRKNGTQYQYGIGAGTTPDVWAPNLFNAGETQYLIFGYDFGAASLALLINPTTPSGTPQTPTISTPATITSIGGFMLRQDTAAATPTMIVDELRIGTTIPGVVLGVNQFNTISGLSLYPNPVTGKVLNITSDANADMSVKVYDVLGKEVLSSKVINNTVNVAQLNAGLYIIKITEEGKTATKKLIIE